MEPKGLFIYILPTMRCEILPVVIIGFAISLLAYDCDQPGGLSWADSYSVDGKCYCHSTYDHDIGDVLVETPAGMKSVREICEKIGPGPGVGDNPVYNTVQCGNPPYNNAGDEYSDCCPGRTDMGAAGCQIIGPQWDLSAFEPTDNTFRYVKSTGKHTISVWRYEQSVRIAFPGLATSISVSVINGRGSIVKQLEIGSAFSVIVPLNQLTAGLYILKIQSSYRDFSVMYVRTTH